MRDRTALGVFLVATFMLILFAGTWDYIYREPEEETEVEQEISTPVVSYEEAGCNVIKYMFLNAQTESQIEEEKRLQRFSIEDLEKYECELNLGPASDIDVVELEEMIKNIDQLAHLIYSEVGILGKEAMYCCGSVVLNRMKSPLFPNRMIDVIYEKGQYEVTWNGLYEMEPSPEAYEIARDLVCNGSVLPENVVFQAQFKQGDFVYCKIGNTYFCGIYTE